MELISAMAPPKAIASLAPCFNALPTKSSPRSNTWAPTTPLKTCIALVMPPIDFVPDLPKPVTPFSNAFIVFSASAPSRSIFKLMVLAITFPSFLDRVSRPYVLLLTGILP